MAGKLSLQSATKVKQDQPIAYPDYNGSIPAGGSYTGVGFNGTWNNTTKAIATSFAVNDTACH